MFAVVNNNSRFITMVCYLVVIAAAFLICLSKEKVEDEMVSQYRLRAIGISAYVNFLLFLGFWLFGALDHGFRFGHGESWWGIVYGAMQVFFGLIPFTTAGLYYLVFKWMLIESGKYVPSTVLALKIARHFHKPVDSIFQLDEND